MMRKRSAGRLRTTNRHGGARKLPFTTEECVMAETQGKCTACKVRYVWTGPPQLRHAHCPYHDISLKQTSYKLAWPVRHETPKGR